MAKDLTITIKVESSAYYDAIKKATESGNLDLYDQITVLRTIAESLSMDKAVVYLNEKLERCICGYMPKEI